MAKMHESEETAQLGRMRLLLEQSTPSFVMLSAGRTLACRSLRACRLGFVGRELLIGDGAEGVDQSEMALGDIVTLVFVHEPSGSQLCVTARAETPSAGGSRVILRCLQIAVISESGDITAMLEMPAAAEDEPHSAVPLPSEPFPRHPVRLPGAASETHHGSQDENAERPVRRSAQGHLLC